MTKPARPTVLQIRGLGFGHSGEPALASGWSTEITAGVTLVLGDTGSGKSSLLRVLARTAPSTGKLLVDGIDAAADPVGYRRAVFFCEPATDAFDQVSAHACSQALADGDAGFDAPAWHTHTQAFALTPHLDKPMYMLSTGSKRKVWLAAALASGRALTLLDEPTSALDAASVAHLMRALAALAGRTDRAIVVASSQHLDGVPLAATINLPLQGA